MNTVIDPQTAVFNQVEELVGTYPSADGLRNAIFALIENDCPLSARESLDADKFPISAADLMTEVMATEYEVRRGIHMHLGVMGQPLDCQYAMQYAYASGCDNSYIWNSNRLI